ncbi:MAG: LPP20 family lipoprotein [Fidelibacterota bacterium]
MNHYPLKLLFMICLIPALGFSQMPDWAKTNTHKKYPSSKYLLGVGISDDKTRAVELARADVAKQIQVKIESELETVEQEFGEDDRHMVTSEITSRTKTAVSETIAGIEIKEVQKKRGQYYALAVMNKANYLAGLEKSMTDISTAVHQYLQNARDLAAKGELTAALDKYLSAENEIPQYYVKSSLYTALTGKRYQDARVVSPAAIISEADELLSSLQITVVSGNNQHGKTGTPLNEPIRVRLSASDPSGRVVDIQNIPVTVKYSNGEKIGQFITDHDGTVSVTVLAAPGGSVIFTPVFSNLPERYRDKTPKLNVSAEYRVITGDLSVALDIKNLQGKPDPAIDSIVKPLISENGATIDPSAAIIIRGQLAITGEKQIPSPAGKQYFIEVELPLELINKDNGVQLAAVSGHGKGLAVGARDQAVQKATENIRFSTSRFAAFLQAAIQP